MTSVRGCGRLCRKRPSIALSVTPSVTLPDSSLSPKLDDKLSNQPVGPSGMKPSVADIFAAATSISKYSENNLQRIFKAVLEAWAPALFLAPAFFPAPTLVFSETPRKKLKACFPNVYRGKSHIDCYNFCQECEDYFATAGATEPTQISFAAFFLWD